MYMLMPKPTIKCSQCGSTNVVIPARVIPEWPANSHAPQPSGMKTGDVALRCKGCGHEKMHVHQDDWTSATIGGAIYTTPKEETF